MIIDIFLRGKKTSWACLETSGLNDIFYWYAHWEIFDKSLMSLFEEFKWSLTTEKIDVSSAKSLGLESSPLGKSFMYTKKTIDLKLIPALMGDHLDDLPLGTTLCCLFLRNELLVRNILQKDQDVLT